MIVAAGTVLHTETVDKALSAGTDYIVCPGYGEEIVDYCISKGVLVVPGCSSGSKIQAHIFKMKRCLQRQLYGNCRPNKNEDFDGITAACKKALDISLGFELAHVGVNNPNGDEALKCAEKWQTLFA